MTTKTFDAVKLMRELRDQLSQDMTDMTPAERILYVRSKASSTILGKTIVRAESPPTPPADLECRPSSSE